MNTYALNSRQLPLDDSWDVIVAGGGPAGCTAAIAAAREGARTLLIESTGALGGSGTSALVPAWCPFSDKEKIIYRGLAEKIFTAAKQGLDHVKPEALDWVPINAERLKRVYDSLVAESGATVLFQTQLAGVEKGPDGGVSALLVANKSGLTALRAKVYIDCTGDADLAAWAGAPFQQGDDNGETQATTLCFALANVDSYAYEHSGDLGWWNPESPIHDIVDSGLYPEIPDKHLCCNLVGPGVVGFNAGHIWGVDNTDPAAASRALAQGRRLAEAYCRALAEHAPAFANAFVVSTGAVLGVRETRRITGDYMLSLDDYLDRRSFPDEICRNSYFIDLHQTRREHKNKIDEVMAATRFKHYAKGESHGIPYRCLTPLGLRNVLVAGRAISCERIVQGSVRVMPVCLAMGEAAGLAAALAARTPGHDVHAVNTVHLRERLREHGAYLPALSHETSSPTPVPLGSLVP
jgi:2-polyprenyl-6-methoxyphenol hydroxylase-like FAD-dependent oxidoreductase